MRNLVMGELHGLLTRQATRRFKRRLADVNEPAVSVVFVGWDPDETTKSLQLLRSWARRTGIEIDQFVVVWNNPHLPAPDLPTTRVIYGTNEELDIGGYAEGLREMRRAGGDRPDDVWLICNDRLSYYESVHPVLEALGSEAIGLARTGCMIGWVCSGGPSMRSGGVTGESWLQTHCFLLGGSGEQISKFEDSMSVAPARSVRLEDGRFCADSDIEQGFLDLLTDGLILSPDSRQAWVWSGASDLAHSNVELVNRKARSVVIEHQMSISWCSHGAVIGVRALPDVLAGYQQIAPGMPPLTLVSAPRRLWWRLRHHSFRPPRELARSSVIPKSGVQ